MTRQGWAAFVNWHNAGAVLWEALMVGGPAAVVSTRRLDRGPRA